MRYISSAYFGMFVYIMTYCQNKFVIWFHCAHCKQEVCFLPIRSFNIGQRESIGWLNPNQKAIRENATDAKFTWRERPLINNKRWNTKHRQWANKVTNPPIHITYPLAIAWLPRPRARAIGRLRVKMQSLPKGKWPYQDLFLQLRVTNRTEHDNQLPFTAANGN